MPINPTPKKAERCTTGIAGLDEILNGGLAKNRLYLIQGDPGVGKTTLALQYLIEGVRLGEPGLYITLSETKEELLGVADSHGWSLDGINLFELSAVEELLQGKTENTFFHPSEIELNHTTEALLAEVERLKPARIVFDSLSEMRMLAQTPLRYRRQILQFKQYFTKKESTVLLLDDRSAAKHDLQVESIAHGVISLIRNSPDFGVARRQLNIVKMRGIQFREGYHDLTLQKGGMVVFPRLTAADYQSDFAREDLASGIPELDALLGGGLGRGTSSMFMGPPGTGKSTLAIQFALAAASQGEKILWFVFDETVGTLLNRCRKLGLDLTPFIEEGTVQVEQMDPAEISPGEMAHRIRHAVLHGGVSMVAIDSINGYVHAMPGENYLNLQLHELLTFLNQQGVITIMVLAQQGLVGSFFSTVDLTYLADTVVLLRFFEDRGTVKQAVSVIKKRSGDHERTIREMTIGPGGVSVGEPLAKLQGVLTGIPRFEGSGETPLFSQERRP